MKRLILSILSVLLLSSGLFAQNVTREEYRAKYTRLISRLGVAGPGIEPHLAKWEASYPDDDQLLYARFLYYYSKCQSTKINTHSTPKFMGQKPVLELKDTSGAPVYYFEETMYDEDLYALANSYVERAIAAAPDRMDYRLDQISAMIAFEKESPDMALSKLMTLADYNKLSSPKWKFGDQDYDEDDFCDSMQEMCYTFHTIGSETSINAFFTLAQKMNSLYPKNIAFIDDLGSYYLAYKRDYKKAAKYFKAALKIKSDDTVAIRNMVLVSREKGDKKSEKKYRDMLQKVSQPAA